MASIKATSSPPVTAGGKGAGMARAAGMMFVATLLSRLLGMARDTIIAAKFGATIETDAYIAAFKIPDTLYYLIAGGALSSTFVPVFSEYWHHGKVKSAWKTFSIVATVTFLIGTGFVVLAEIFTPQFVRLLNPGYSLQKIALTVPLTRIVLPAQVFFLMGGLLMGTQNARGMFKTAALAPSIYNIGIIVGALVFVPLLTGHVAHPIAGLMWGALLGAFIGNFLFQLIPVVRLGLHFRPSLQVTYPGAVKIWKMMLPILLGVSLPNVDQIINSLFASSLPNGAQTYLQYANRIMLIPIGIFGQAMGIAILPTMAAMAAANQKKEFKKTTNAGIRVILFLTVPASALFYLLAEPVVALLYHHQKFTGFDVLSTAVALRMYAIGICVWSAQAILTRGFYALQDSRTPVISGTVMTVVFFGMNWFVVHETNTGIAGLALSTTIAATMHLIIMFVLLRRRTRGLQDAFLTASVIRIAFATAILCLVTAMTENILSSRVDPLQNTWYAAFDIALPGAVGILAYSVVSHVIHAPELSSVTGMMKGMAGRFGRGKAIPPPSEGL